MKQDPKFIILLVIAIAAVGYAVFGASNETALEAKRQKEAYAYTSESVQAVTGTWSVEELKKRAHPLLLQGVKESGNSLEEYFKVLSQLGATKKEGECKFLNVASVATANGRYVTASHMCEVEFANGPAAIGVEARQENMTGPWQIVNFQVNSPFFSQKTGNPKEDAKPAPEKKTEPAPDKNAQ